jgi:hypothetical protein
METEMKGGAGSCVCVTLYRFVDDHMILHACERERRCGKVCLCDAFHRRYHDPPIVVLWFCMKRVRANIGHKNLEWTVNEVGSNLQLQYYAAKGWKTYSSTLHDKYTVYFACPVTIRLIVFLSCQPLTLKAGVVIKFCFIELRKDS